MATLQATCFAFQPTKTRRFFSYSFNGSKGSVHLSSLSSSTQTAVFFQPTITYRNYRRNMCPLIRSENESQERNVEKEHLEAEGAGAEALPRNNDTNTKETINVMEFPTQTTNRSIAVASAMAAVSLFLVTRGGLSGATLGDLAATSIPYEEAMANGRPTVVEFYADWCEVCREMAPDVYKVEQQYKNNVNFVMLNVDNTKWEEELDEFGVEGIPHFAFLDKQGNEEGNIVGRLPKQYFEENVIALSKGESKIPHSRFVGQFSKADSRQSPKVSEPRSHG